MGKERAGRLKSVLDGTVEKLPPVWLMRQAGRYLPEYQEARKKKGSFWDLCMDPEAAAEVTLQPVWRFDVDAAILFSDILLVPHALGRKVVFDDATGPRLEPLTREDQLIGDSGEWSRRLGPAYETLRLLDHTLASDKDLIGFAGGPWTLASYMIEGQGSVDSRAAKLWGYRDPESFERVLSIIADCVAEHLCGQLDAGATVVQIFDSWAGGLSSHAFAKWVIAPTGRIVEQVRRRHGDARIIGFPRGATEAGYVRYASETGVNALSLDTAVPLEWAAEQLGSRVALQGNLDPLLLVAGGAAMAQEIDRMLAATRDVPFIANLGHGVLPQTPIDHVAAFVQQLRGAR